MRIEGANIIPFTANNLNILVTAVVSQLPNVTAKDIVISQVCQQSPVPRDCLLSSSVRVPISFRPGMEGCKPGPSAHPGEGSQIQ